MSPPATPSPAHASLQQPYNGLQQHLLQCHAACGVLPSLRGWLEVAEGFVSSRQVTTLALSA